MFCTFLIIIINVVVHFLAFAMITLSRLLNETDLRRDGGPLAIF